MITTKVMLATFTLSLLGCATTGSHLVEDDLGPKCTHPNQQIFKITTKDFEQNNTKKIEFYEPNSKRVFSGITSANVHESNLILSIFDKDYWEQYSAPQIDTIREKHREGDPLPGVAITLFTAGLIPLIPLLQYKYNNWYNNWTEFTFGCTDKSLISSNPDATKKIKTGKSEWRDANKVHKFLISGFDKDYEFDPVISSPEKEIKIDLSKAILNSEISKNTTIKISCLDCDLQGQEEINLYKDAKKFVELNVDLREIKVSLTSRANALKLEQEQRVKEEFQLKKQSQGVPLENFKTQCKELGYKVGTPDFGNCVLELNNIK